MVAIGWTCLSCGGLAPEVFKLGDFYLPDFVEPGESRGEQYPLRLVLCEECSLLQLSETVSRDSVIHERYGFMTGLNEQNRRDVRQIAAYATRFAISPRKWLDIGCNDGELLRYAPPYVQRVGVDPLLKYENFSSRAEKSADELVQSYFDASMFEQGEFDVITSTAMFYALDDPARFTEGVRQVLATRGVWVIQQNYALDMIRNNTVDNIIHEHVAYYTVRSLQHLLHRHGLEIFDLEYSDVKGGCFRTAVCHRGARPVQDSVERALTAELDGHVDDPARWVRWAERVGMELQNTRDLLDRLADKREPVFCLGAGNRGGTLVQLLGPDPSKLLWCAVERSEAKVGKVWTSAGIPIISEEQFRDNPPRYALASPWFFRDGLIRRESAYLEGGGAMIFPLPQFELVAGL